MGKKKLQKRNSGVQKGTAKKSDALSSRATGGPKVRERRNNNSGTATPKTRTRKPAKNSGKSDGKSGPARILFRKKRTIQLTEDQAKEKISFKYSKGKKPTSNTETAAQLLADTVAKAKKKFSRKKGRKYAARITLKWQNRKGQWVKRSLVQVSASFDSAIQKLLEHEEINSLTYERHDEGHEGKKQKIHSKTKKIVAVSFDKYVERRKISKAPKAKKRTKKTRGVRR